jgi:hypothetical protein
MLITVSTGILIGGLSGGFSDVGLVSSLMAFLC